MSPRHVIVLLPGNGGLALARALVRDGQRVTLIVTAGETYLLRSRGVCSRVVAAASDGELLEALSQAAGDEPSLVVPGADRGSEFLALHRHELPASARAFEGADGAHRALMDKQDAYTIARAAGVRVPWTVPVRTLREAHELARQAPYPCLLKPALSHAWRAVFGRHRVLQAANPADFERHAKRGLDAGLAMVATEYVPGGDDCVEEAILVRRADGSYPVSFGCRKLRQYPPGFGAASICLADHLPESTEIARRVLDEAQFVGVAGVETKRDVTSGQRSFLEVNVRLPTQWGLGDASGVDASRRAVAVLAGDEVGPQPPLEVGVKLVLPELEIRSAHARLRTADRPSSRAREAVDLLRSYRRVRNVGILDPRDPGPGLARAMGALRRRARLPVRRR